MPSVLAAPLSSVTLFFSCSVLERLDCMVAAEQERISHKAQRTHVDVLLAVIDQPLETLVQRRIFAFGREIDGLARDRQALAAFRQEQRAVARLHFDFPLLDRAI